MWENNITVTKIMVCEYRMGFRNSGGDHRWAGRAPVNTFMKIRAL
jgi:hypothetical protein